METFTCTSDKLYDRHNYKLVLSDGNSIVFDNYEDVQNIWMKSPPESLSHVEVLDKKKKSSGGFK